MAVYPLAGLPRQGQIWSWMSYDVANQSFTLLINTLLFSLFFTQVVVTDESRSATMWSLMYAASMLLTVVISPIAGAIADERGWKKLGMLATGMGCAVLTCLFGLIPAGGLWIAVLLYIPANCLYSLGENFLSSFLPELCEREQFGKVSGFSWGVAYFAALVLLGLTAAGMIAMRLESPDQWRPFFVFAGIWFAIFTLPTLLFLKERPAARSAVAMSLWTVGFVRLGRTVREVARFRDLAILLVASMFYGTAMSVVIFFASILAEEFGFKATQLVIFTAVITVSGVLGTLIPMRFQDRFGHRRMMVVLLLLWLVTALGLALVAWLFGRAADQAAFPRWPVWLVGNFLGFGLGSLGTANRAFVGYLAPSTRSAEFFGLWGLVFRLAAIGTIPFAVVKDRLGTPASLLVLAGFVVVGLLLTLFVDERRGVAAARAADAEAGLMGRVQTIAAPQIAVPVLEERAGST